MLQCKTLRECQTSMRKYMHRHALTPRAMLNCNVHTWILQPLDTITWNHSINHQDKLIAQIRQLKSAGVRGCMVDVWYVSPHNLLCVFNAGMYRALVLVKLGMMRTKFWCARICVNLKISNGESCDKCYTKIHVCILLGVQHAAQKLRKTCMRNMLACRMSYLYMCIKRTYTVCVHAYIRMYMYTCIHTHIYSLDFGL